jgi:hypothetical protein
VDGLRQCGPGLLDRRQVQVTEALPPGSGATVPVPRPPM